jgi:nucleotide-binding universal stress UspA family protein
VANRPTSGGAASAELVDTTGRRDDVISRRARLCDLVVFGRSQAGEPIDLRSIVESTLLDGGRSIAIAWNGSVQAAHAVTGAMPLLREATSVHILTAETRRTSFGTSAELARYLGWHRIESAPQQVTVGDDLVGAALLRTVAEVGADLLVLGGYGRTRLRELVMGGVTRHVLSEASVPVLLAH